MPPQVPRPSPGPSHLLSVAMVASGAVGRSPAAGVPTPRPAARVLGRPRALGDPRRAQTLPPRAPAAPPRSPWSPPPASLHPSRAQPAGSRACPALPTPQQHPSQRQSSQQPGPLLSRYLARPIRPHTFFLASLLSVHPGLALLSSRVDPEPQLTGANLGNRWERAARITSYLQGLRTETHQVLLSFPCLVPKVKIEPCV